MAQALLSHIPLTHHNLDNLTKLIIPVLDGHLEGLTQHVWDIPAIPSKLSGRLPATRNHNHDLGDPSNGSLPLRV